MPTSSPATSYPPTAYPSAEHPRVNRAPPPNPISIDRARVVEASPYSWTSQNSRDGLIRSPSPSQTITQGSPLKSSEPAHQAYQAGRYGSMSGASTTQREPVARRAHAQEEDLQPAPLSTTKSRESNPRSLAPTEDPARRLSRSSSNSATIDPAIAENAHLANMYQEVEPAPSKSASTNKVMTPAQWQRYKKQKEADRRLGALSDDSNSDTSDHADDEDEVERDRQAVKRRREQEAHLAIYRQKMMKVTGETGPSRPESRPESSLNALRPGDTSSAVLDHRMSHMTLDSRQSGEDEDEDEDVPLGILAAHGFPNKHRPPTRAVKSPSNTKLRRVSQTPGAPSVRGGSLPPFARQLPPDPYYGAGLVSPTTPGTVVAPPQWCSYNRSGPRDGSSSPSSGTCRCHCWRRTGKSRQKGQPKRVWDLRQRSNASTSRYVEIADHGQHTHHGLSSYGECHRCQGCLRC